MWRLVAGLVIAALVIGGLGWASIEGQVSLHKAEVEYLEDHRDLSPAEAEEEANEFMKIREVAAHTLIK